MLMRRLLAHLRNENWFAVVLDLLVVIVGLFLGLQIDTWWEAQKDARLEAAYLLDIREDFERNKFELQNSIGGLETIARNMLDLQQQCALPAPSLSVTELNERFRSIHSMPTFIPASRAYANLTGSGDLKLIRSRQLKNALAEYYAAAEVTALVQSTHEMELVQTFQPYIIDHLDYAAVRPKDRVDDLRLPPPIDEASILKALATRNFRNIVAQKWVITTDLLDQHRGMLKRTNEVLQLVE
jgi:hypothetical protein